MGGKGKGKGKGEMMQMFAWMMQMKGKGKGKGGGWGQGQGQAWEEPAARAGASFSWKSELIKAYAKTYKVQLTKETIAYTTSKEGDSFTSSVACEKFEATHSGEGNSEKAAVEATAEAALRAEFPDFVKEALAYRKQVGSGKPKASKSAAPEVNTPQGFEPWRSQLARAYAGKHKAVTKDCIKYATETVGEKPNQYQATVSSENFATTYTGEPSTSMKFAQDSAAMIAMQDEFPEEYKHSRSPKTFKGFKRAKRKHNEEIGNGKRQKGEGGEAMDPKSKLNNAMSLLATTPITKASIEYATITQGNSTFATVTVNCMGSPQTFTGEATPGTTVASKKPAEASAAEAAFNHFSEQNSSAMAEHAEKKKEKDEKKKSEWRVLIEKKKEEKAAEKAAKKETP